MNIFTRILYRLRRRFFPTDLETTWDRWTAAGGDDAHRFDYPLGPDSIVLDLGGYRGDWAAEIYARYRSRLFVFEPASAHAESIRLRFRANPDIRVFDFGLAGRTRRELLALAGESSSVFHRRGATEEVQLVDIAEWLSQHGIHRIALMKINIEGGEYELLERLAALGLLPTVDHLQIQFHKIAADSDARVHAIQQQLTQTHTPTYQYPYIWESWSRRAQSGELSPAL
mgnify:CR=1 FL=1